MTTYEDGRAKRQEERRRREEALNAMTEAERELRLANWADRGYSQYYSITADELGRPIVVTPFEGAYGVAGYVVCINGSPPRGAYVVLNHEMMQAVFDVGTLRQRKPTTDWGPKRGQRLRKALLAYLQELMGELR
jgi:hypothetical protein